MYGVCPLGASYKEIGAREREVCLKHKEHSLKKLMQSSSSLSLPPFLHLSYFRPTPFVVVVLHTGWSVTLFHVICCLFQSVVFGSYTDETLL